jgi:hypothetical protein
MDIFNTLSSIEKKKKYIRNILNKIKEEIGTEITIKTHNSIYFDFLNDLMDKHSGKEEKLKGRKIKDFKIKDHTKQIGAIELHIIYENDETDPVSWVQCCGGKKSSTKENFIAALRVCIEPQIKEFRKNLKVFTCWSCGCDLTFTGYEVDHVNPQFAILVKEFVNKNNIIMPTHYDKEPILNRCTFKEEDKDLSSLFYEYHKSAELKQSCFDCNRTRSKYRSKKLN